MKGYLIPKAISEPKLSELLGEIVKRIKIPIEVADDLKTEFDGKHS
jgi:hypothetical protein